MTAQWIVVACLGFMIAAGAMRGRAGVALADAALLVFLLGLIGILNVVLVRFFNISEFGWTLAGFIAAGFALDALYGLMAPARQRQRDQWLRTMMQRKRA